MATSPTPSPTFVVVVPLVRTVSSLWIMSFHLLMALLLVAKTMPLELGTKINSHHFGINYLLYKLILKSVIGVEMFFVLGGFNLSFNFLQKHTIQSAQSTQPSFVRMAVQRYLRLAPIAFVVMALAKLEDVALKGGEGAEQMMGGREGGSFYRYLGDTKSFSCET